MWIPRRGPQRGAGRVAHTVAVPVHLPVDLLVAGHAPEGYVLPARDR